MSAPEVPDGWHVVNPRHMAELKTALSAAEQTPDPYYYETWEGPEGAHTVNRRTHYCLTCGSFGHFLPDGLAAAWSSVEHIVEPWMEGP